jgi:hypothetical protein
MNPDECRAVLAGIDRKRAESVQRLKQSSSATSANPVVSGDGDAIAASWDKAVAIVNAETAAGAGGVTLKFGTMPRPGRLSAGAAAGSWDAVVAFVNEETAAAAGRQRLNAAQMPGSSGATSWDAAVAVVNAETAAITRRPSSAPRSTPRDRGDAPGSAGGGR